MMYSYKKRRAACIRNKIIVASAVTVSCAALVVLYNLLWRDNVLQEIFSNMDDNDDEVGVVHEENTGDSYEI